MCSSREQAYSVPYIFIENMPYWRMLCSPSICRPTCMVLIPNLVLNYEYDHSSYIIMLFLSTVQNTASSCEK
jgi:hypothetical protein